MATDDEFPEHCDNNYEKYKCDMDIKFEEVTVQSGDFLDSKVGISLDIKVENLNQQLDEDVGSIENCEEYNNKSEIKLEEAIVESGDSIDSKAGISLISHENVVQSELLKDIKDESLDQQLDEDVGGIENCPKYNNDTDIKLEDSIVQPGDFLDSKAGISPISDTNITQSVKQVDIVENSNKQMFVKVFRCNYCGLMFLRKFDLTDHFRTHTGAKPFTCEVCKKSFSLKNTLKRHYRMHTGEKPFTCDICNKTFRYKSTLKDHITLHTGKRPLACDICKRTFNWKSELRSHMKIHTGERPFTCETCNKSFSAKSKLKSHMKVHTGEKPFTCGICGMSFRRVRVLENHTRKHTGEEPFTCNVCNKSFTWIHSLKAHMKRHTGEKSFTCDICKE